MSRSSRIAGIGIGLSVLPILVQVCTASGPLAPPQGSILRSSLWLLEALSLVLGLACLVEARCAVDPPASVVGAVRRLATGYSALSVLLVSSVGLFLVVNLLVGNRPIAVPSGAVEATLLHYPEWTAEDARTLLAETWERPHVYAPWTGFQEAPRRERFVNVHPDGFRLGAEDDADLGHSGARVFVLGGSTTFGYGVDDASTIPARIEPRLRARYPELDPRVFNFGRGWYYSGQEVALLVDLLRQGKAPDLVVMIDGLNEGQADPHYTPEMARMFGLSNDPSGRAFFGEGLRRLPLMRRWSQRDVRRFYFELPPEEIVDRYRRNRDMVRALASGHGFRCYFFVQPVPSYRNRSPLKFVASDENSELARLFQRKMELLDATADGRDSFSMAGLLDGHEARAFVDAVHYSPEVNDLLAGFIAERVDLEAR